MEKEYGLGETFTFGGHTVKVTEVKNPDFPECKGCFFLHPEDGCFSELECMAEYRSDCQNVIYKEVERNIE